MENAKLIVKKTKKGNYVAELAIEKAGDAKGKIVNMPFPQLNVKNDELNGVSVEVERDKGKIVTVKKGDEVLFTAAVQTPPPKPAVSRPQSGAQGGHAPQKGKSFSPPAPSNENLRTSHVKSVRFPARAPYNFVPLNEKIVELKREEIPDFDCYHENRHTGRIDLEIETLTPLYIRGTLTEEQVTREMQSKDSSGFFSPGGKPAIPGSSLRGMARTLVEIAAWGKFENYDDKSLYFRGLADTSNLRKEYQDRMSSYDFRSKKSVYKISAGLLRKNGRNYLIESCDYKQVPKAEAQRMLEKDRIEYRTFTWHPVAGGYLVISGDMNNKKRDWLIANPRPGATVIPVPEEDVESYKNDITRDDRVPNIVRDAAGGPVPCFYVLWRDLEGNDRVSFGHTGMFRLAYVMSIGDHVPLKGYRLEQESLNRLKKGDLKEKSLELHPLLNRNCTGKSLKNALKRMSFNEGEIGLIMAEASLIDIPEAIFGNEKTFGGRVFFEDAKMKDGQTDVFMGEKSPKILSSPKPTTFQHYLVQTSDDSRDLNHYNSPAALRGYKCYWHKSGNGWEETDRTALEKHASQYTRINPVRSGVKFSGTIRFENLSDVELGALLFALDLPEGCSHKLGMGKPLGLGSVKITPKLRLSDRTLRYRDLFAELDLNVSDKIQENKLKFEQHIMSEIGQTGANSLWETERMRELQTMLNLDTGRMLEAKNRYMNISPQNDFKRRPVLPSPSGVK